MDVAILLDGDFTRRLVERKIRRNPKAKDIEDFCSKLVSGTETITGIYYYDCPPFAEKRLLPISGNVKDFATEVTYHMATKFQADMANISSINCKKGYLSFRGWAVKDTALKNLISNPCVLTDSDFKPILTQKQVDMLIGVEITELSFAANKVKKIYLVSSDSDFLPAVQHAQSKGVQFVLVYDKSSNVNKRYANIFDEQRIL